MSYMVNATRSLTDPETTRPLEVQIILTAILVSIITLAIIGNILVFLTILGSRSLRKQIGSIFLFNLALTDIGCAILVMPYALVSLWQDEWIFGDIWCDGVCFLNYCFIIVSMSTLALISLDRYVFVVHPMHYNPLAKKNRAIICCGLGWIIGSVFGAAPSVAGWVWYDNGEIICAINWESDQYRGVITYTITAFVVCFMFPMFVMCIAYLHIYKVAKSHSSRIARSSCTSQGGEHGGRRVITRASRYNTKAIRTILIMILAYAICNTPFSLTKLIKVIYSDNEAVPTSVSTIASWLGYVSPCCNPIIYAINREEFRNAFLNILCLKSYKETSLINSYSDKPNFSRGQSESNKINSTIVSHELHMSVLQQQQNDNAIMNKGNLAASI